MYVSVWNYVSIETAFTSKTENDLSRKYTIREKTHVSIINDEFHAALLHKYSIINKLEIVFRITGKIFKYNFYNN